MSATKAIADRPSAAPLIRSSVWLGNSEVEGIVGATTAESSIPRSVIETSRGSVEVTCDVVPVTDLDHLGVVVSQLQPFDLAFVSTELGNTSGSAGGADAQETEALLASVHALRATGAHVFLVLPSTLLAPSSAPGAHQPGALALHASNIAGIHVASKTGASVIDLDRLVAETGGGLAISVSGPCRYTDRLLEAARAEVIRILLHYRLLDSDANPVDQPSPWQA